MNRRLTGESALKHNPALVVWDSGDAQRGLVNAIIVILMPYVLRQQGVAVDRIAEIVAVASIPNVWYFLYSPVVDLGLRRRTWILLAGPAWPECARALAILLNPHFAGRCHPPCSSPAGAVGSLDLLGQQARC